MLMQTRRYSSGQVQCPLSTSKVFLSGAIFCSSNADVQYVVISTVYILCKRSNSPTIVAPIPAPFSRTFRSVLEEGLGVTSPPHHQTRQDPLSTSAAMRRLFRRPKTAIGGAGAEQQPPEPEPAASAPHKTFPSGIKVLHCPENVAAECAPYPV